MIYRVHTYEKYLTPEGDITEEVEGTAAARLVVIRELIRSRELELSDGIFEANADVTLELCSLALTSTIPLELHWANVTYTIAQVG